MTQVAILDYGMGNLRSVEKALERVGVRAIVTSQAGEAEAADGMVLPGVGAFPAAMARIRELGLDRLAAGWAGSGRPLLGICLGMQLLFERSSEHDGAEGLGLLPGEVTALDAPGLKVPHMGWEPVSWTRESPLTAGLADETPFYFVHSFAPRPADEADVLGTAVWGEVFPCVVERDNVWGVQFHPEKSSTAGLRVLANFAGVCAPVPA